MLSCENLKRYTTRHQADLILSTISACAQLFISIPEFDLSPDLVDIKIIATAISRSVDYLVTGHKTDLLLLGKVNKTPVVSTRQAVTILNVIELIKFDWKS